MKIAYLFSRYPVPSQTFCDTEICALEAAGHEIEIYSCSAPTTSFRHGGPSDWPRAEVLYAPPPTVLQAWEDAARADGTWPEAMIAEHAARFGPRYDPARRARHALYFADRLRRRGVEHLHVHFANRATHAALFIRALTGVSFSFTAHAQDFLVDLGSDDLLRLMCEQAAFVVTVSDWSRATLLERCPAAAAKIHCIHNGLDLERWPVPLEPPQAAPGRRLNILSVGRLVEFKGFQDLINACHRLRERGVSFACEIVGDGPWREELARQASAFRDPQATVALTGFLSQEEVRARLNACGVFVLASRVDEKGACDVLPTVILEAMACGKPVVSTRLAGIPEMVEQARTGLLVPPGDPVALADAIAALATGEDEPQLMGSAGRRKLEAEFSADDSARLLSGLFAEAAAASSFVPVATTAFGSSVRCVYLFDQWPLGHTPGGTTPDASALQFLRQSQIGCKLVALKPGELTGAAPAPDSGTFTETLHAFEFLPDAVVFETQWRNAGALAYQLEGWRGEVGGGGESEEFLLACRRALYLKSTLSGTPGQRWHLHAVGAAATWCAWLLRRLEAVESASFLLLPHGAGAGMKGSTLRKLAPVFTGGWIADERKLAASLGAGFKGEKFDGAAWLRALDEWAHPSDFEGSTS